MLEDSQTKARILIEALPYIRAFSGKTFVIKYGGSTRGKDGEDSDRTLDQSFADDLVLLVHIGIRPVVVHGGGPDITRMMDRMGLPSRFVDGLRVTDREGMEVVEMVLSGKINRELVTLVQKRGGRAVGLAGRDGNLLVGERKNPDLGFVGRVRSVNTEVLDLLDRHRYVTIVAPVGVDDDGNPLNINADEAASEIAGALKAEKLIMMTDTPGVLGGDKRLIPSLTPSRVRELLSDGTIHGGMVPKISGCLKALDMGVRKAHIIDGRIPHALLLEIFTPEGVGTEIRREQA
ncbi:acetylglutamate kinase [Leptospirillum ferriphilum]|uniref:acetylglutamate kinase n=1 Tax=Leptospirillum ferriphilum TaxID=178606 RepID=UPI0006B1F92E|nr:acetylglutamate kinase [Leptospirillum ferriphilum]